MGREIRKVPKNWEHPKYSHPAYYPDDSSRADRYHPLFDEDYEQAAQEWVENFLLWQAGQHPGQQNLTRSHYFWEWEGNPPEQIYYRSKTLGTTFKEPADHFQVYETVSEGTPISPKFSSLEEMEEWLVAQGYSKEAASAFCKVGNAPSMISTGGKMYEGIEASPFLRGYSA